MPAPYLTLTVLNASLLRPVSETYFKYDVNWMDQRTLSEESSLHIAEKITLSFFSALPENALPVYKEVATKIWQLSGLIRTKHLPPIHYVTFSHEQEYRRFPDREETIRTKVTTTYHSVIKASFIEASLKVSNTSSAGRVVYPILKVVPNGNYSGSLSTECEIVGNGSRISNIALKVLEMAGPEPDINLKVSEA
ncbi:MAG: hypothetical protein S4CHLAM7_01650 [Chlamydiae bacterium]|nr:hypothetical protein [Chlamydiota bacterium]